MSPGTGPACPWDLVHARRAKSWTSHRLTVGEHHWAGKETGIKWRRMGAGWRENRWMVIRGPGETEQVAGRVSTAHLAQVGRRSQSSLPPPAGLRGTRRDAREPLPGRPPPDSARLLPTHPRLPKEPLRRRGSWDGEALGLGQLDARLPAGACQVPPASLSSVPDAPTVPTDQAGQLGPQLSGWLIGAAATPGLTAGALRRQWGRGP